MTTNTKNILTREGCKTKLIRWAKGKLLPDVVLLGVMLLIFVPLIFLSLYVSKYILILGIVFTLICTVFPIAFVFRIVLDVIALRCVKKGDFSIEKDTVLRLSQGEISKTYSMGRSYVDVIYFKKFGRHVVSKGIFDISSVGDEFYLVILHAKKEQIVFAFHSIMYDCKDIS